MTTQTPATASDRLTEVFANRPPEAIKRVVTPERRRIWEFSPYGSVVVTDRYGGDEHAIWLTAEDIPALERALAHLRAGQP